MTHPTLSIRPAVASDAADLATLAAETFRDTFAADNDAEDMALHIARAYGPVQQAQELADSNVLTILVTADDRPAAYAQLRKGSAPACVSGAHPIELWRFYVAREWHGRGIARELMRHVDATAHLSAAETLWLGVWERNERAKAFYRKCGFVDVGSHVFMVGTDAQTDRILTRPVDSTAVTSQ
jgi:ribosomal protein S18 acetylase RimI-like enzyme